MSKLILGQNQVDEIVGANLYPVNVKTRFISRCIDGRYKNSKELPALATAGADAGELAVILATANIYGFEVDQEKVYKTLVEIVGGKKNLSCHTDSHGGNVLMGGCGHIRLMGENPESYNLDKSQADFIKSKFDHSNETTLEGEHLEGAVLIITGDYGVMPGHLLNTKEGDKTAQVFVFHKGLVDMRHRELAKKLIKNKAITSKTPLDEEYLYEVLSSTTDDHLFETAKTLAVGLPIYSVAFSNDGSYKITAL